VISRFKLKLPIPVAAAIVAAAYLIRSILLRGGDFSLDLVDAALLLLLMVAFAVVAVIRGRQEAKPEDGSAHGER
jgi:membrane glycosyltransferase